MKYLCGTGQFGDRKSRPARGAWIEIQHHGVHQGVPESRPAWGAWIEIPSISLPVALLIVAPRMGRVD